MAGIEVATGELMVEDNDILNIGSLFEQLRFSETNHIGLGDIRLTIGQQEDIVRKIHEFENRIKQVCSYIAYEIQNNPNDSISDIFNDGFIQCNIPLIMNKDYEIRRYDWSKNF